MTHNRTADYWISPNALRIELNAMSLPDYIQASCTSGAQILCYLKDIITYDAGHNYRRWTLQASPTAFNTHTPKYVYVAIPRDMTKTTAQVVFPSEKIDIYGKAQHTVDGTTTEEQVGSEDYYYIFLQGILSSSGDNGTTPRQWTQRIDTGTLSSDEALNANNDSEWYQYSTVDQITTFLKDLTMKAGTKFYQLFAQTLTIVSGGKIKFGTDEGSPYVDSIAQSDGTSTESTTQIVTPKYMDDKALSKSHDDVTAYDLTMKNLRANGTADIFGNVTIHDGASLSFGTFNTGLTGGRIQSNGDAELKSLVLRESLTVPKLVYNRVEVMAGNTWRGSGGGEIKTVTPDKDADNNDLATGIATLQLEEGELGMIAVGDICQGIFHLQTGNDILNTDEHNGNFHFAGFKTIYFEVTEILDTTNNSRFRYKLRAATDTAWTDATHPQPHMNFAVYGNRTRQDRQASAIDTTQYHLLLAGVSTWNYTSQNIQYIEGYLNGFTIDYITYDRQGNAIQSTKQLSGYGVAIGKMYQWGNIEQFDRANAITSQQLYFASTQSALTAPADITLTTDRTSVQSLGTWQTDAILPTPAARYVWQQWLYGYADGTYAISQASIYAMDSSLLLVTPNRAIVPIAVSDFYDPDCPDDLSFDISAQIKSGTEPLAITTATAQFDSDSATLTYTTQLSADNKTVTYHLRLQGYVGTTVNGVTPEDSYITLSLTTAYGTGTTTVTLVQNREGEDGQDGKDGQDGSPGLRGYEGISVRRSEWEEGVYYRNDSADGSQAPDGNRYLDEVCITNAAQNTADWYVARPAHNGNLSAAANKPTSAGGSTYWQKMNDLSPIRTPYADIQTAFIQFLRVAQITLQQTNSQGQDEIYGAFGNPTGANQWPLWFGATTPANAPFRVNAQGEIISANINTLFQDMRPITGSYEYMNNENQMDLAWIKQGSTYTVVQEAGVEEVPTQIQKNVFNLRVDGINVILPTASSWIGQRVLLYNGCRKKQAQDNVDLGQEVTTVQIITPIERDENGYLLPNAGVAKQFAGARQQNIKTNIAGGQSAYQLNTTSYCYEVEFWDGVMEFIGVPDDDGTCIWAIINDSAGAVWYDGNPIRNMI